jgi:glucose/arabinose dehydrogenase
MKRGIVAAVILVVVGGLAWIYRYRGAAIPALQAAPTAQASVFTDYRAEQPGAVHKITISDLPEPYATDSAENSPDIVPRPANAWPQAPAGFKVELYASGLDLPRLIRSAPNGDLFLAESHAGEIKVFRGITADGRAQQTQVFATGLHQPFGINFYPPGPEPQWVYVANTDSVVRFPYRNGDLKARGRAEVVVKELPGGGRLRGGGHWTRDIAFANDGSRMFVSVGSRSNDDDTDGNAAEYQRADILEFKPDGSAPRVYAWGIRNAVGIAIHPDSGELWCSTNERDQLGDNRSPTTSPTSPKAVFTAGPGGTWEDTRTRATRASIRS